jgi:bacteriocin-like protein
MNEEQVKELFSDKEFVQTLMAMDTPESIQAALKEKDLDLTLEEIELLNQNLEIAMENGGELTEEQLAQVSGGSFVVLGVVLWSLLAGVLIATPTVGYIRRRW